MALDFAILDSDGNPETWISVDADTHWKMVGAAKNAAATTIMNFSDYYEDAIIPVTEMGALLDEIIKIKNVNQDAGLKIFLDKLENLARQANVEQKELHSIAD